MPDSEWQPSAELLAAASEAQGALRRLARLALDESGYADRDSPEGFPLAPHPGEETADYAERLHREISHLLSDACEFQPGKVYCYQCADNTCAHSQQSGEGAVFGGYDSLGQPTWQPLFGALSDLDDLRVDRLFSERPPILSRVMGRKALIQQQLVSGGRGSMTYHIHGQLIVGYFRAAGKKHALTFQLVETSDRVIHGQLICSDALEAALAEAEDRNRPLLCRVDDAIKGARRQLGALNPQWKQAESREARAKIRKKAFRILSNLEHSMDQKGRQFQRRSTHAEERGRDFRPVHKASEDLAQAGPEQMYRDTVRKSIVVTGKGGRAHVFADSGRHITSLVIQADKLERLKQRKRYAQLPPAEIAHFRTAVHAATE